MQPPPHFYWPSQTASTSWTNTYTATSSQSSAQTYWVSHPSDYPSLRTFLRGATNLEIPKDWRGSVDLPDGSRVHIDGGNFSIDDANAKITYKANRVRNFNRYLNASDLLEEFILFLGTLGVRQSEVLEVPIDVFVHWVIMRAAQEDGEPIPDNVKVENHHGLPSKRWTARCKHCQRFIPRSYVDAGIYFCSEQHFALHFAKLKAPDEPKQLPPPDAVLCPASMCPLMAEGGSRWTDEWRAPCPQHDDIDNGGCPWWSMACGNGCGGVQGQVDEIAVCESRHVVECEPREFLCPKASVCSWQIEAGSKLCPPRDALAKGLNPKICRF